MSSKLINQRGLSIAVLGAIFLGLVAGLLFFGNWQQYESHGAGSNIDSTYRYAWNDVIGWIDFRASDNVIVGTSTVEGVAQSAAIGSIYLDCASSPSGCSVSYGVVNDAIGNLSGNAWNENIGWINFCGGQGTSQCPGTGVSYRVTINGTTGDFSGYAWNDVIGLVSFNCIGDPVNPCGLSVYKVKTNWTATPAVGWLESAVFDTGVQGGAQINSILWKGVQPDGTYVRLQMAFGSSTNGPWVWGWDSDGIATTSPAVDRNISLPIDYVLGADQRYFRYRIYLYSDTSHAYSPQVDDVIVNWSR